MYDLYRFMSWEHAESFLRGELYMSTLGRFWPAYPKERDESGEPDGRMDCFEGTALAQRPENCPLPDYLRNNMIGDLHYLMNSSQYVNLLCMVQHFGNLRDTTMTKLDSRMLEWGPCAVRIRVVGAFLERLRDYAMKQGDDYFLAGPVQYLARFSNESRTDCFNKMSTLSYQHEWRIAYISNLKSKKELAKNWTFNMGPYEEPLRISIGPIDDIADIIPSDVIFNDLESKYDGFTVVDDYEYVPVPLPEDLDYAGFFDQSYWGWGDRRLFQDKIASIDGGKLTCRFVL